ncbi:uncharacterized protein CEXT_215551 [Caerostris extrusa]|uniref:Uncharacterized protein n=1 Tax=Caerostris extrusa TaxID=172846 RepID=A0AAV4QSC9_CAEEX|nr:uncharacterized protein CEXT_215551 [Caerostris extrusa]
MECIWRIDAGGPVQRHPCAQRSEGGAGKTHHQTVKIVFPEQSTDAVIYVTVVVVFYAAIILILVGTNIHRFRRTRAANGVVANGEIAEPKQQVVVRLDHKERAYQVSASPEEIKAEVENQETDGALV